MTSVERELIGMDVSRARRAEVIDEHAAATNRMHTGRPISGRSTTRSTAAPRAPVMTIAMGTASSTCSPMLCRLTADSAPITRNSPCAKLK